MDLRHMPQNTLGRGSCTQLPVTQSWCQVSHEIVRPRALRSHCSSEFRAPRHLDARLHCSWHVGVHLAALLHMKSRRPIASSQGAPRTMAQPSPAPPNARNATTAGQAQRYVRARTVRTQGPYPVLTREPSFVSNGYTTRTLKFGGSIHIEPAGHAVADGRR
jgi:hypothetical protein